MVWQRALAVLLAPYAGWLVLAYEYHFLDGVNLAFHEAGHLFLGFAGQALHVLGGTIGQLFFPSALALRFARRGERFEAAVCVLWLGESLMYAAAYLGDAKAQALPRVGGHIHDWAFLLARAGLLEQSTAISRALHLAASLVVTGAWLVAARAAFAARSDPRRIAPGQPLLRRSPD